MITAFLSANFGCMVTRVVVLKTQIMLSIGSTERFSGKVTDPPRAPTSFFSTPEAAGPAETENRKINLSSCPCHQLLTPFRSQKGPKKPSQSNPTSPGKPFGTSLTQRHWGQNSLPERGDYRRTHPIPRDLWLKRPSSEVDHDVGCILDKFLWGDKWEGYCPSSI